MVHDFLMHCERFKIGVQAQTRTNLSPNQGFLIPLTESITLYCGQDHVHEKMPWMDTYVYAWSFFSESDQEVEFIRVEAR